MEDLKGDLDIPGFDEDILKQMVSEAEEVTDRLSDYGTLDEQEIKNIKERGKRTEQQIQNIQERQNEIQTELPVKQEVKAENPTSINFLRHSFTLSSIHGKIASSSINCTVSCLGLISPANSRIYTKITECGTYAESRKNCNE